MDFKVAGTQDGITALQMDIKVPNVTTAIMKEALEQARRGRLFILDKMNAALAAARADMSPYAPRIYTLQIPTDKIRDVIGPGGKVIRGIIEQTGVKIDVEDDGTVHVASADGAPANKALQIITDLTATAEVGKTYLGKVVRIVDFGAFVEIFPGTDGLLHISEIAENRIKEVRDELKEGDQILVKVLALEGNKIKLSRKAVLEGTAREAKAGSSRGSLWGQGFSLPPAFRPVPGVSTFSLVIFLGDGTAGGLAAGAQAGGACPRRAAQKRGGRAEAPPHGASLASGSASFVQRQRKFRIHIVLRRRPAL